MPATEEGKIFEKSEPTTRISTDDVPMPIVPSQVHAPVPVLVATTTATPSLVVMQKATLILEGTKEHQQQVPPLPRQQPKGTSGKQILFLDDYEQIQSEGDDEDDSDKFAFVTTQSTTTTTETPLTSPHARIENTRHENRMKELEEARQRLRQQLYQEEDDGQDFPDEDEDEDLFFFKPGYLVANSV